MNKGKAFTVGSRTFGSKTKTKDPSTKVKEFQGKGKTLEELSQEDRKIEPTKQIKKQPKPEGNKRKHRDKFPEYYSIENCPVRIGKSQGDDKWKCQICMFVNNDEEEMCKRCDSKRGEKKERNELEQS